MNCRSWGLVGIALCAPTMVSGQRRAPEVLRIGVPRAVAPVVDGRLSEEEWHGAAVHRTDDLLVRVLVDGPDLYLAISSPTDGFPSLCVVRGDTVQILHASAALGAVAYVRGEVSWTSRDTAFTYSMRETATDVPTTALRREYYARHGWVASTFRMGEGRNYEFRISRSLFDTAAEQPTRLAFGYYRTVGNSTGWPSTLSITADGCVDPPLVRGTVPARLLFAPATYPILEIAR